MAVFNQYEDYYQLKHADDSEQLKSPSFHLQGTPIPIFLLGHRSSLEGHSYEQTFCSEDNQSLLDSVLLAQWEDRAWKGLLNYDVTTCEMKVTDGVMMFVTMLNEESISDHSPVFKGLHYTLNPSKFKCMAVQTDEHLFSVKSGESPSHDLIQSFTMPNGAHLKIIINANPVEYGHIFIIPIGFSRLSAFMDADMLELVTRVAVETNNCSFRIFYDFSPSSCDHLYFQACYFVNPLPVELMPVATLSGNWQDKGVQIFEVTDYPIKTLSFKSSENLKLLVKMVAEICSCLQNQNISYSLLINDLGTKMFLFPQVDMVENNCALSALECGGHFVFKERHEFDEVTEEVLLRRLTDVSLGDEGFLAVKHLCCNVADKLVSG
ncbi:GDP-L-galactose/GDP-D-glucose: hexose 1-phosphate guanylyltransferase [Ranunculus cassubicifolius]